MPPSKHSQNIPFDGGWKLPEVAVAQAALVERELAAKPLGNHFQSFLRAMEMVIDRAKPQKVSVLADIGCGVGHYGTLMRRYFPNISYMGIDGSQAMIDLAQQREPTLNFLCGELDSAELWPYDVVLASQVIEYARDPYYSLQHLLEQVAGWVILHKLRLDNTSHWIMEPTYCGNVGKLWLWKGADILIQLEKANRREMVVQWDNPGIITVIVEPRKRE